MTEYEFNDFIRDRYDSPMVNALIGLKLTSEQMEAMKQEIESWD